MLIFHNLTVILENQLSSLRYSALCWWGTSGKMGIENQRLMMGSSMDGPHFRNRSVPALILIMSRCILLQSTPKHDYFLGVKGRFSLHFLVSPLGSEDSALMWPLLRLCVTHSSCPQPVTVFALRCHFFIYLKHTF